MTEALASKTCTPCRGGIPPLTREQAELFTRTRPRLATGGGSSPHRAELPVSQFPRGAYLPSKYLRINSRLRPWRRILRQSPLRLRGITGDRECCAPGLFEGSIMPQSQRLSPVIPFVAIERPACPKCKAPMMLVSIALARPGVDLHTFECAICNRVHKTLAAYEDPMKSKGLGRWLQGDLHSPR
jgi:hypothetical protein